MEQLTNRACDCKDAACGAKVTEDAADWREGLTDLTSYADADADQATRFQTLATVLRGCVERSALPTPPPSGPDSLDSSEILARKTMAPKAQVKHILLGWTAAHATDPRGVNRDRATLEALVKATVRKLKSGAKIDALMAELSEDPGSAASGMAYDVTPDAGLVPPFKDLSLRLHVGEVGVVKSEWGIHIIQRVK